MLKYNAMTNKTKITKAFDNKMYNKEMCSHS